MHYCLYCENVCGIAKDDKNPLRWRLPYQCRSTHSEHGARPYKVYLQEECDARGDDWANEVRLRVKGALSGLHAVEVRYHKDGMSRFFGNTNLIINQHYVPATHDDTDSALLDVVRTVSADNNSACGIH